MVLKGVSADNFGKPCRETCSSGLLCQNILDMIGLSEEEDEDDKKTPDGDEKDGKQDQIPQNTTDKTRRKARSSIISGHTYSSSGTAAGAGQAFFQALGVSDFLDNIVSRLEGFRLRTVQRAVAHSLRRLKKKPLLSYCWSPACSPCDTQVPAASLKVSV